MPAYCFTFQAMVIRNIVDVVQSLQQDTIHGDITETPGQEPQKTCDRNSPCLLQGCMIGSTPTNHVRNQDVDLSNRNANPTSPNSVDLPQPPTNHTILFITSASKLAIRPGDQNPGTISPQPYVHPNHENQKFDHMFILNRKSNLDLSLYDCSNLHETRRTAIINSFRSSNIPVPFWNFYDFLEFTPKFTTKPNPSTKPDPSTKPNPSTNQILLPMNQLAN